MKTIKYFITALILIISFSFIQINDSYSQIVYQEVTTSNGFYGMGAFKSKATVFLSVDKRRSESKTEFMGSFMKHFNPKGKEVQITRLDREFFWRYNTQEKKYVETPFAMIRKMFEEGKTDEMFKTMPSMSGKQPEDEQTEYSWEKPVVKVREGQTRMVNKFKCKNYIVKVTTVGTHRKTGIKDTITFVSDIWNSLVKAKAMVMMESFNNRLAEKLGFEHTESSGLARILASYKDFFKALRKEMKKLKGYPVKNTTRMIMTNHARRSGKSGDDKIARDQQVDVSNLGNALSGLLGKKAKSMAKQKAQKNSGSREVFQFTHEIKSIRKQDIAADQFEVPNGYQKIMRK